MSFLNDNKSAIIGGAVGGPVGAVAGGIFGKKKSASIDISAQLAQLSQNAQRNRGLNNNLLDKTTGNLGTYKTGAADAIGQERTDFAGAKSDYLGASQDLTTQAKDDLRANLYSKTFSALPGTIRAVKEASAAGGGLDTGSYQQQLRDVGNTTARTVAEGERDIQVSGANNMQAAQTNVFNQFNQLSQKLSDQQLQTLTKVLDTGDMNAIRQATTEMGLNDDETQGIISLLNFKQSGQMASDQASEANKYALLNALIGGGSKIAAAGV